MKILIINLPKYEGYSVTRERRCESYSNSRVDTPASLLIIASLLRNRHHKIEFIDANGLNFSFNQIRTWIAKNNYECVIFSFNSSIIDHELQICEIIKEYNNLCFTIGFSWYARSYAKDILTEFEKLDIQIIGEPISLIEELIECLETHKDLSSISGIAYRKENNSIILNTISTHSKNFDDFPLPAYDLIKTFKPYYIYSSMFRPYALIYAGIGCPYRCNFCKVAETNYSGKSAKNIIKELKFLKKQANIKYVWFFDEVFTLNRRRVIEICNEMILSKLKIKWFCDSRVNLVDLELLRLMKKAGCIGIAYGIESGSQKILNNMNKGINLNQIKNALSWTREVRIPIQLNLILGYIGETSETLKQTRELVVEFLPETLQVNKIGAFGGTKFFEIAFNKNWIDQNSNLREKLNIQPLKSEKYFPFKLNLDHFSRDLYKTMYFNPKWWLNCLLTIIKNKVLIFPTIEIFIRKMLKRKKLLNNLLV